MKSKLGKLTAAAALIWLLILGWYLSTAPASAPTSTPSASSSPSRRPTQAQSTPEGRPTETAAVSDRPPTPTVTPTPILVAHVIQSGEYPLAIADQYGISVDELMALNQIEDPAGLQIGQRLLIPITVTPTPRHSPTPTPTPQYHTVQQGDTLLSIANRYETGVDAIIITNNLSDSTDLSVGEELLIPPPTGAILDAPTIIHQVAGGDTLLYLANRYGSTVDDILLANSELQPERLQVGQRIIIPLTRPREERAEKPHLPRITTPEPPPPYVKALEEEMVEAVNARRQANGLPPYAYDEALFNVARAHVQDMVNRGYFSHINPDGQGVRARTAAAGLDLSWVGENIQRNTRPEEETVQYAVEWFMNSPPHRRNILHPQFDSIGVGVTEEPAGWFSFVLVFGTDS